MAERQILGFQFEPTRKNMRIVREDAPGSGSDSDWEPVSDIGSNLREARCRKPVENWCQCKKCQSMPYEIECKCCHELQSAADVFDLTDSKCITDSANFHAIVLLKENLWAVLVGLHDKESCWLPKNRNVVPNRSYRFAAYRQFTWWVHNKGTKGVRRVIPSCVVSRIREEFPSPDGTYVGFIEGQEMTETDVTWLYRPDDKGE